MCLSVMTYHLLADPALLDRLRAELVDAMPDPHTQPRMEKLEALPYLTACIQEGLRLSYGVSGRLARISPDKPMVFNDGARDWYIPPGVSHSEPFYLRKLIRSRHPQA